MKKISLITVYNNKSLLDEMVNSAKKQVGVDIEYVLIDNRNKEYSSASKALNAGFKKSTGEVVVFLHQDIEFLNNNVLKNIYDFAINNKNTIFGAAGVYDSKVILSSMKNEYGRYDTIDAPEKAMTLDECLIACYRDCLNSIKFDEKICDGWHLYGADLCLQALSDDSLSVMVVPMDVWHKSSGNADKSFFVTLDKIAKAYKNKFEVIYTTNSYVYTNNIKRILQKLYRKLKYNI